MCMRMRSCLRRKNKKNKEKEILPFCRREAAETAVFLSEGILDGFYLLKKDSMSEFVLIFQKTGTVFDKIFDFRTL